MTDENRRAGILLRALACLTVVAVVVQIIIDVTVDGRSFNMMSLPAIGWALIALSLSARLDGGDVA